MSVDDVVEVRNITLVDGTTMCVEMSLRFIDLVRRTQEVMPSELLTDEHVKQFILASLKDAQAKSDEEG